MGLFVASMFLFGIIDGKASLLIDSLQTVSLRFQENFTEDELEELTAPETLTYSTDVVRMAVWGEAQATAENNQNGLTAQTTVISYEGDADLIWPQEIICGSLPGPYTTDACLLSSGAAAKIFGSTQLVGVSMELGEKTYEICGLFENPDPIVFIHKQTGAQPAFKNLELEVKPGKDGREIALNFANKLQLRPLAIVNGPDLSDLIAILAGIPLFMIGIALIINHIIEFAHSKTPATRFKNILVGILLLFVIQQSEIHLPENFIPTRWSDFAYWERLAVDYQIRIRELLSLPATLKDIVLQEKFLMLVCYLCLGVSASVTIMILFVPIKTKLIYPITGSVLIGLHLCLLLSYAYLVHYYPIHARAFGLLCIVLANRYFQEVSVSNMGIKLSIKRPPPGESPCQLS